MNLVVKLFAFLGEGLNIVNSAIQDNIGLATALAVVIGGLIAIQKKAAEVKFATAQASAVKKAFEGGPKGPLGIALSIAAALAGVALIGRLKASTMDDGFIGPGGETIVSGPKGTNVLNPEDSMIVGTNLFGKTGGGFQNEKTKFYPRSPYAASKVYAHWITINYRESYNIFACNGILFNHESPVRGETFVTKKIISGLCKIKNKKLKTLYLGNIYAKRDWGHARDYVEAMWKILQQRKPDDFVIATGRQYTVKQFINLVCKKLKIKITWRGKGINERAYDENGNVIIKIDKNYFRPNEVEYLKGDARKAFRVLKFKPKYSFKDLVKDMIESDLIEAKKKFKV